MNFSVSLARTLLALLALPLAPACLAGEHAASMRITWPRAYVQECAACHVAYPPQMLPAVSWARLMDGLDRHFGSHASLDAGEVQQLSRWLQDNADRRPTAAPPPDHRITRTARFTHKHRQISSQTWQLPSVRSAANCMACHIGADQGRYSEHALRMPEGLSAPQRAAWND